MPANHKPSRKTGKYAVDEQTGESFELETEDAFATAVAAVSAIYSTLALLFLLWLLFDTWSGRNVLLAYFGYDPKALAHDATFRIMAYVAIGGALGGVVDAIRSLVAWHSEHSAYGPRFIWRDFSLPLVGATVGLLAYVTVRSGAGVFDGDFTLQPKSGSASLSAFALAALAGFSARQVFRWLDTQANRLFNTAKSNQTAVPDLDGKTVDEVKSLFKRLKLHLGTVKQQDDAANIGKVVKQSPAPGAVVTGGTPVDIAVGADPKSGGTAVAPAADPAKAPS